MRITQCPGEVLEIRSPITYRLPHFYSQGNRILRPPRVTSRPVAVGLNLAHLSHFSQRPLQPTVAHDHVYAQIYSPFGIDTPSREKTGIVS